MKTRIAHMIHEHFHYSIKACVMDMLKNVNSVLNDGIVETVKIKLNEISDSMKIETKIK